jgi:hypothetical protein
MSNRDAEVLYPDGQVAHFSKEDMSWTIINEKGKKQIFKDGVVRDVEAVPTALETDPDTLAKVTIREDNVCTVEYPSGAIFVKHADGT